MFRHALPPSWLLGDTTGSLPPCPSSIWSFDLRMKLAIIAVCRTWNQIGVEILYNDVTLRRISQVAAFVCALESREGLGTLVKSLDINCAVPPRFCALLETSATKIFQLCPRLSHFGFCPTEDPMDRLRRYQPQGLFPLPTDSITSLQFNNQVPYHSTILPMLVDSCRNLRVLALPVARSIPGTIDPRLVFENLEELDLALPYADVNPTSNWVMPRVRRVCLRSYPPSVFLTACGRTLFSLSLLFLSRCHLKLQDLLDCCPALQHLALPPGSCVLLPRLKHATINWIDVFSYLGDGADTSLEALKDGFPSLRTFRILDNSMSFLRDIPDTPWHAEIEGYLANISGADDDGLWITAVLSGTNPGDDEDEEQDDSYIPEGGDGDQPDYDTDRSSSDSDILSEFTEYDEEEPVFDFFDPTPVDR